MRDSIAGRFVGQHVRRTEDRRLLRGAGTFIDDVVVPGMLHAAFVRSPFPHARVTRIDIRAAAALPGVQAVITGAEMATISNPMVGFMAPPGMYDPMFHALSIDTVRHVGDPVALVVAESRRVAEDAAALVDVGYDVLPAVATAEQAFDPARPPIWSGAGSNVLRRSSKVHGDIDAAFASADRVVSERLKQTRHSNQPMETRGAVAEYLPGTAMIRYHASHQSVHVLKWGLGMFAAPVSFRTGVRQVANDRDRMKQFFRGAKQFAASQQPPKAAEIAARGAGYVPPSAPDMKPMIAQFRAQKGRFTALAKNLGGIFANGPDRVPEVVVADVGGAFGSKTGVSREDVAVCAAARHLRRSIKWIEDRNENLMVGGHARDESGVVEVAVRHDGTILGMRVHLTFDVGAYPGFPFNAGGMGEMARVMIPGPYRVPALQVDQVVVATNKATIVPYRGPWAIETWLRERMLDIVARSCGLTRAEVRLRNIIGPDELPTPMVTGPMLDVRMSAKQTLEQALELAEFDDWPAVQAAARAEGRIVGMGLATFIEAAPGPPGFFDYVTPGGGALLGREPMRAVLRTDGTVALHTQQVPHGQGIATTLAQVAADELGVPYESVEVVYGKTAVTPFGLIGTGGSRSAAMAGGATAVATRASCAISSPRSPPRCSRLRSTTSPSSTATFTSPACRHAASPWQRSRLRRFAAHPIGYAMEQRCARRAIGTVARAAGLRRHTSAGSRSTSRPVSSPSLATWPSRTAARSSTQRSSTVRSAVASPRASAACCTSASPTTTTPCSSQARISTTSSPLQWRSPRSRSTISRRLPPSSRTIAAWARAA